MGKKTMAESSAHSHKKASKKKQQLNSDNLQIKLLKPRVYITDSWNFKSLVQELTGNNGGSPVSSPLRRPVPVIDDLELLFESSEASAPATSLETYDSTGSCMRQQPDFKTLESWLLDEDVYVPMMAHQEEDNVVSVYDYDLSFSSHDFSIVLLDYQP